MVDSHDTIKCSCGTDSGIPKDTRFMRNALPWMCAKCEDEMLRPPRDETPVCRWCGNEWDGRLAAESFARPSLGIPHEPEGPWCKSCSKRTVTVPRYRWQMAQRWLAGSRAKHGDRKSRL